MTHKHPPIAPIQSRLPEEAAVAESCYSRWSPLFGNGPDHVTTKWWKLWAVCKLSISTERLGAGNKAGNLDAHPCSETQEDRDSRAPAAVSRWMLQCGDKKKRETGICSCVFPPPPHSQQTGSKCEGGAAVISTVLWKWMWSSSASSMEAAHNSWCWFSHSAIVAACVILCFICVCVCVCVRAYCTCYRGS